MKRILVVLISSLLVPGFSVLALGAPGPAVRTVRKAAPAAYEAHPATILARGRDDDEKEEQEFFGKHKHEGKKHHKKGHSEWKEKHAGRFFRPVDRNYFRQCYGGSDLQHLPPGLRKQVERTGHLPPGLEKHLRRNGQLPPGLQKRMTPANGCVLAHIGPLPVSNKLYILGRDAYLINSSTRQIIDVLRGAY